MIKIKYSIWPYIKSNGQVAIRVRWNSKQYEVAFITGVYADPTKWDEDGHKAIRGTKHVVRNMSFDYSEINDGWIMEKGSNFFNEFGRPFTIAKILRVTDKGVTVMDDKGVLLLAKIELAPYQIGG